MSSSFYAQRDVYVKLDAFTEQKYAHLKTLEFENMTHVVGAAS